MRDYLNNKTFLDSKTIISLGELYSKGLIRAALYSVSEDTPMILVDSDEDYYTLLGFCKKHCTYLELRKRLVPISKWDTAYIVIDEDINITVRLPMYATLYNNMITTLRTRVNSVSCSDTLSMLLQNLCVSLINQGYTCMWDLFADPDKFDTIIEELLNDLLYSGTVYMEGLDSKILDVLETRVSKYVTNGLDFVEE